MDYVSTRGFFVLEDPMNRTKFVSMLYRLE